MDDRALSVLLILAGAGLGLVLGLLVHRLVRLLQPLVARTRTTLDDALLASFVPGLPLVLMAAGLWFAIDLRDPVVPDLAVRVGWGVALVVAAVGIANFTVKFLRAVIARRVETRPQARALATVAPAVGFLVYTTAGLVVLGTLGIQITPILASLGIGGLAVAWALQDTLSNVFAGWWIRASREIRPGHYVRMDDKRLEGYVNGIGWRTTRIRTLGGQTIIVPNGVLGQAVVTNFSIPSTRTPVTVTVDVPLDEGPERILALLLEEAQATVPLVKGLLADPAPTVQLSAFTDYSLRFNISVQVAEYVNQFSAQDMLRRRVAARLRREGVRLAVPVRETIPAPRAGDAHARDDGASGQRPPRPRPGEREAREPAAPEAQEGLGPPVAQASQRSGNAPGGDAPRTGPP